MRNSHSPVLFDSHLDGATDEFGDLPEWDLSDLYADPEAPQLISDRDGLAATTKAFASDYAGKLAQLSGDDWLVMIRRFEDLQRIMGRLMSYAGLRYYQMTTDPERAAFLSNMQEAITNASGDLVFFSLEINAVDDSAYEALFNGNEALSRYRPYFDRIRAMKPYQLSDEMEKFLHDQSVVGASAWNRLFDETMAGLEIPVSGETLGLEAALNLLTDADGAKREAAYNGLAETFEKNLPLFARITNTLIKEKEIEDTWRKLPTPQSARHISNHVEPEVVDALKQAVVAAYPDLSHRYYKLKARWMGCDKLAIWDRNAPLPQVDERKVDWEGAKRIVLDAYGQFDPRMAQLASDFFEKDWIDAGVKPGKAPGAFAHPAVTDAHPFILLNYMGKPRDVMTLAHELGHGVHQRLAANQGELLSSTPLTLAETASVFGEMLTFRKLIDDAPDERSKSLLLAGKVEDMLNTVVRQIAFYDFEGRIHAARRSGEMTPAQINEIWLDVQKESLGEAFDYPDSYGTFWTYIPHFIHSPFYVYAYAFGDGLVNALYAVYEKMGDGFEDKYFDLLEAGGSKHHTELLAPFGLDPTDPGFWSTGLQLINDMISELEKTTDI